MHDAAVEFELPAAFLGMGETQRKCGVCHGVTLDMHHTCTITRNFHSGLQACESQRTFVLRLRSHQVHANSAEHHQHQGQ